MEGLSTLTGTVLPFIMLIAFAGVRILGLVRRQARNREQSQKREAGPRPLALVAKQGSAPQKSAAGMHPWEIEEVEQGDPDDEFSAWSLSVTDDEPVPSKALDASTASVPVSAEVPAWLPEVPGSVTAHAETRAPEAAGTGFRSLPPLQQGVIWAEILGTPKGF